MPTVSELRSELGKRKLSTRGTKGELQERLLAATSQEHEDESKRVKGVFESIADEYLCPITHELPIDPVTAEDGKIYERSAIDRWLWEQRPQARSPVTGAAMGRKLLPATQVRNVIEQLVKSGAVGGDKAASWEKKLSDQKVVKKLMEEAEAGDSDAILRLGSAYIHGHLGLPQDAEQGLAWLKRGADMRDVHCMAAYGYWSRFESPENKQLGLVYLAQAAQAGSNLGAAYLGNSFVDGGHGLPQDARQAKYWLSKVVKDECEFKTGASVATLGLDIMAWAREGLEIAEAPADQWQPRYPADGQ